MKKSLIRYLFAALLILTLIPTYILAQQSFEDYQKQQQQDFNKYVEDEEAAFKKYKADVEEKWRKFLDSTKEEWVSYSEGKETKRVVNFEEGYVEIETLVEATEPEPLKKAQEIIKEQVQEIVKEKEESGSEILEKQIATPEGKPVTPKNVEVFAQKLVAQAVMVEEVEVGKDKIERLVVKVRVPLVPDHLKKRAEKYLPDVRKYCKENDLDIAMVLALMHTESYFNPKAKSHAPAFGLMQLVPRSGGREAFKFVFGKDKAPNRFYLYNSHNNIQLGTGYLRKMRVSEFKNIKNSQNALYCMICAYNTGPGNVAKAITGERKLGPAVKIINTMTPDELYAKLVKDLPYEETRDYIKRIVDRAPNYVAWR
ncbi:MAG: murein transglycosylase domain-containing protein [Candidatus Hatepunaea meridiana]|nr:murein transglycosylase domain-containing protein [Candidatus Hatepunaea meridiana]